MDPKLLMADLIAAVHLGYVAVIVIGQVLIVIGALCGWGWVRNPAFRWTHLIMITVVALEAVVGLTCPLTTWELSLRAAAGVPLEDGSFVSRLVSSVLLQDWPGWVFTMLHLSFAALVLATMWLAPPRSIRRRTTAAAQIDNQRSRARTSHRVV